MQSILSHERVARLIHIESAGPDGLQLYTILFSFESLFLYFFKMGTGGDGQKEKERENPKQALCCQRGALWGSDSQTMGSRPEPKSDA